jgi:hypothetical protein
MFRLAGCIASICCVASSVLAATMDPPPSGGAGTSTAPPAGSEGISPAAPPARPSTPTPTVAGAVIGGAILIGIGAALAGGNGESAQFSTGTGTAAGTL